MFPQLGNLLKKQPFNLNLKKKILTRSKECKKLIKKKTKQYKKRTVTKFETEHIIQQLSVY
jgi:hypothetical protein